jgi:hypothetical protein
MVMTKSSELMDRVSNIQDGNAWPETIELINDLCDHIEDLEKQLRGIADFGKRHSGHGYSCAMLALQALGEE